MFTSVRIAAEFDLLLGRDIRSSFDAGYLTNDIACIVHIFKVAVQRLS